MPTRTIQMSGNDALDAPEDKAEDQAQSSTCSAVVVCFECARNKEK